MKVKDVVVDMHQGINTVADKVEYLEEGIPIIQSKNFTRGFLDLEDVRFLGKEDEEKYIEKNVVNADGQYTSNTDGAGSGVTCTISNSFYISFWGNGGGNKITASPVIGDIDGNGVVNELDLTALRDILIEKEPSPGYVADFNRDTYINICDYVSMKVYIVV